MQYLTTPTAQALSWALLHSLWQGMLIMFTLMLALRCVPTRYSRVRYNLALTALLGVVVAAAVTFTVRLTTPASETQVGSNLHLSACGLSSHCGTNNRSCAKHMDGSCKQLG